MAPSELEFELRETAQRGRKWLVNFDPEKLVLFPYSSGKSTYYSNRLHDFSVTISRCYKDVYANNFFPRTARLSNCLPIECILMIYDLNGFKLELILTN